MHPALIKTILLLIIALIGTVLLFKKGWVTESNLRARAREISISLFTTAFLLCLIEFFFAAFMIQSDGFGFTLSSQKWFDRYWHPINEDGYRDIDHEWKDNIVLITGDSFAAGHGLKSIDQRFSAHLKTHLGNEWSVAVIAQNGWGPEDELEALRQQTVDPDIIIVSYYPNDIHGAAESNGLTSSDDKVIVSNPLLRPIVNRFYLANYLYWRLARSGNISEYWTFLDRAYADPDTWNTHTEALQGFIDYADEQDARLAFVIWP